jgi:hypothetical protein
MTQSHQRDLEDIHRNVDFANRCRLEYVTHLMSLAAGIFAVSIAFTKDFVPSYSEASFKLGLVGGWLSLVLSLVGGIFHMKS